MIEYAHRWSGAPGAFCLDCGTPSAAESALACPECRWTGGGSGMDVHVPCPVHQAMAVALQSCPPTPESIREVNRLLDARGEDLLQ